jgi:hypothetical protein
MPKLIDITGARYGRLTALGRTKSEKFRGAWLCVCDCGERVVTPAGPLRNGHRKSCGCLYRERPHLRARVRGVGLRSKHNSR